MDKQGYTPRHASGAVSAETGTAAGPRHAAPLEGVVFRSPPGDEDKPLGGWPGLPGEHLLGPAPAPEEKEWWEL